MTTAEINLVRGDKFAAAVRLGLEDFDWEGTVVRCQLRSLDGRLIWDFSAEEGITSEVNDDGQLVVALVAEGADTRRWPPGRLECEVEVEKASGSWGPYTPARITLNVLKDVTR